MAVADSPHFPDHATIPGPNYVYWGGSNLYVNLTSRCSAACTFCLRSFTWEVFGYDLLLKPAEEPSAEQVKAAAEQALAEGEAEEVVFTGLGEPTLRLEVLLDLIRWAKARSLPTRLDTNGHGQLLNPAHQVVRELAEAGLDAVSVSLNAPDAETYEQLCAPAVSGAFPAVVSFMREAVAAEIAVTATAVTVPGLDLKAVRDLAGSVGASFRARWLLTREAAGA